MPIPEMMSTLRNLAFQAVLERKTPARPVDGPAYAGLFNRFVFDETKMRQYLSKHAYRRWKEVRKGNGKIDRATANEIANGMKQWALEMGVTHYTHWFQPMTGLTAEKHDAFLDFEEGQPIERFSGQALFQQEPDASSFPSGGLRNTFEARGYTAWDPNSMPFIFEMSGGRTLCIPTIFISYTGEALDYKTPLLRTLMVLKKSVKEVAKILGMEGEDVAATLGVEQEYFLIDRAFYVLRKDLVMAGRTLLGRKPARGQQLEDHYFGFIPERVYDFMTALEKEAIQLGIPLKTRHNEVAPSQFECAPLFEEVNQAVDHNQLLMNLLRIVARRKDMEVLLHEKPFEGINGSGKHCNWSIGLNGTNLLNPGKTRQENLRFLVFFINVIKAVHSYHDLVRASIASPGNDHRLGANEAPPAIISIFIGNTLRKVLEELKNRNYRDVLEAKLENIATLDIPTIPEVLLDTTDRNRTSPFAFTGNKFELRAVGSSANTASPMIALNLIVADQLAQFVEDYHAERARGLTEEVAIMEVLARYIHEAEPILFEGDNYSEEWKQEAVRRGLRNLESTPEALDVYKEERIVALFQRHGILKRSELEARYEILMERYVKQLDIEAQVLRAMVLNRVVPTAMEYLRQLADAGISSLAEIIRTHLEAVIREADAMEQARRTALEHDEVAQQAYDFRDHVKPFFERIRTHTDELELLLPADRWPLPKYWEMLFLK